VYRLASTVKASVFPAQRFFNFEEAPSFETLAIKYSNHVSVLWAM
jgi:hypothetical protein